MGAACAWRTREGDWEGKRFHLGDSKEAFDAEVFAIYQAPRAFWSGGRSGRRFAVFSDCQPAIQRARSDALGPGQCWARAIIEVASRLVAKGNEVAICWVPAHVGVTGNEKADEMAKGAAGSRVFDVQDEVRWQASPPLPLQASHREQSQHHLAVGPRPRSTGAPVPTPGEDRPPMQSSSQSPKVNGTALLPAVVRPRCDWLLPS